MPKRLSMNVLLGKSENIQNRVRSKRQPLNSVPLSTTPNHEDILNERPLKLNSQNLAFHGLSGIKVDDAVAKYAAEFGEVAGKYFKDMIEQAHKSPVSTITINPDNTIKFTKKSNTSIVIDTLTYPFLRMPLDIINTCLGALKKIPGLKNAKLIDSILNASPLKKRSDVLKELSDVAGIQQYFEILASGKSGFGAAHKRLSPSISNYSSITDRTMTRLVSGVVPAFFLANDAYNLSVYMNKNQTDAKEQKRKRFNQEIIRVALTAWSTFVVMNIFAKKSNSSMAMSTTLTSIMVVVSEMLGRYMAGNPIFPVTEAQAKKYAAKAKGKFNQSQNNDKADETSKNSSTKNAKESDFSSKKQSNEPAPPPKHGILTLSNALNLIGGLIVFGFVVDKIKGIKKVSESLKRISASYDKYLTKDFIIDRKEFDKITEKLEQSGFNEIAEQYRKIASDQKGDKLNLGRVNSPLKRGIVHFGLVFPLRYAWGTIMLPYEDFVKPTAQLLIKKTQQLFGKTVEADVKPKKKKPDDKQMLINSIGFIRKIMDKNETEFKDKINESLFSSLDNVYKANYSNAELGSMFKIMHSAITSLFLVSDNYNVVMVDSNGEDKELASQKAKERTVQRAVRLIYGAFLIKLFNTAFTGPYNSSLLAAQSINAAQAVLTESLERSSVGLPIGESTKEDMIKKEKKHLQAKGIVGAYYRTMAVLTGKKAMSETSAQ